MTQIERCQSSFGSRLNNMTSNPASRTMKAMTSGKTAPLRSSFTSPGSMAPERPFSSPLNSEKAPGSLQMRCCGAPLFSVEHQVRVWHRLAQLLGAGR